ncbi:MAG: hypothetical protein EP332_10170 [Bacteroidetes bacterium]|nr:MAG: hypothetical protein EP332_10170 [Bacteroidota bacterium]
MLQAHKSKLIHVLYFEAASGHRSAAQHIVNRLNTEVPGSAVMLNLTEVTDRAPRFGSIVRAGIRYFNYCLQRGILFDLGGLINLSLLVQDTASKKTIQAIADFWAEKDPSLLISVTPMYNALLHKALAQHDPSIPYLCVPVDLEEGKSRYWFDKNELRWYACASTELYQKAKRLGIASSQLRQLSGMPASISETKLDRAACFTEWGFNTEWPTCFVSFGGQGTVDVLRVAKEAKKQNTQANFLFFCGKNKTLFTKLKALNPSYPHHIFSYLPEAPTAYLSVSDLVLGKPGAMTLAEAQLARIPLFALKSKGLKLVQRGNERYIQKNQLGLVANSVAELVAAIPNYSTFKESAQNSAQNNALEELLVFIHEIIKSPLYAKLQTQNEPVQTRITSETSARSS